MRLRLQNLGVQIAEQHSVYSGCTQIATKFGSGVDKLPLQQRYEWAADHHAQIFEAAENPVHGSRWWMEV